MGAAPDRGRLPASAAYLTVQTITGFALGYRPHHSPLGLVWTALTATAMFALAAGKHRTGQALANPVLIIEGRVTTIDALLACAVFLGLALNARSAGGGPTQPHCAVSVRV